MPYAIVRLTPEQLEQVRYEATACYAEANLRYAVHGNPASKAEAESWAGIVTALEGATINEAAGPGRRPNITDEELWKVYERCRTVRNTCKELGYSDHYHISGRLKALGADIHPGRPKKQRPPA